MSKVIDDIEKVVDELRDFESNEENRPDRIFTIRRQLQEVQVDYLKQGERIPVTKVLEIICKICGEKFLREDDLYLHLRIDHEVPDIEAAETTKEDRTNYERGLHHLQTLLTEFTEALLEETPYG